MLTNPIRGKAGKQIVANSAAAPVVIYTVPAGKYFEMPFMPANLTITANGVTSANTALTAVPMLLQAGSVVTAQAGGIPFIGTEYDA
jgi:formylmethanofuran dehydrogenase subunit D